jgi:sarcosine oxidase
MGAYETDVVVVGTGTMGSMTLWQLASRGVSCIGIDQYGIAHDQGAAGGDTRFFRSIYREGVEYIPLLREAIALWRQLEAEAGVQLLTTTGALYVDDSGSPWLDGLAEVAMDNGLPFEILDAASIRARYPQHGVTGDEAALLDVSAGFIRADLAIASAIKQATERGAQLHLRQRVRTIEPDDGGVTVRTDDGTYRARCAVLTPGPWDDLVPPGIRRRLNVSRVIMPWYMPLNATEYSPEVCPAVVRERGAYFGLPSTDGVTVKFGATCSYGDHIDPNAVDRSLKQGELDAVDEAVRRYLPGVMPNAVRVGIYHEAFSDDHHAFVGMHPDLPNIVIGCGFSGHGFKMAPTFGAALADFALGGRTSRPVDFLEPKRPPIT